MIENRQLRYFVTAARLLHITRAAEALHIAQPALTRNIHQLEEELGVALFHRVRKRISLTEAGQTFLVEAERLLEQVEESMMAAQKAARGELGRLVIGFVSTAGLVAVPQLIAAFRKRYPGPMIVLKELESEELDLALRNGVVDVGLQYGPYGRRRTLSPAARSGSLRGGAASRSPPRRRRPREPARSGRRLLRHTEPRHWRPHDRCHSRRVFACRIPARGPRTRLPPQRFKPRSVSSQPVSASPSFPAPCGHFREKAWCSGPSAKRMWRCT